MKVKTVPIKKEDFVIYYKGNHNYNNTKFEDLLRALDSTDNAKMNALRILGDLSRDFNTKTV